MKKLLGILVLGLLLASCAGRVHLPGAGPLDAGYKIVGDENSVKVDNLWTAKTGLPLAQKHCLKYDKHAFIIGWKLFVGSYECKAFSPSKDFVLQNKWLADRTSEKNSEGYKFFTVDFNPITNTYNLTRSQISISDSEQFAKKNCQKCVIVKSYDVTKYDGDKEKVWKYIYYGYIPKEKMSDISIARKDCEEMGFASTDPDFKYCVLRVVEMFNNDKNLKETDIAEQRQLYLLGQIRESQKRERKREKHWQGIKQMDRILNKGAAF